MLCWLSIPCQTWHGNRYVMLRESGKKNDFPVVRQKKFCKFIPFIVIYHLFPAVIFHWNCVCVLCYIYSFFHVFLYTVPYVFVFEKLHPRQLFENNGIDRWRHVIAFHESSKSQTIKFIWKYQICLVDLYIKSIIYPYIGKCKDQLSVKIARDAWALI